LPVVKKLLQDLRVREIVDQLCPIREAVADYTHGQMVEILIANRLSSPHPLYRFDLWCEEFAAAELFGVDARKLNDDRLGRTLDATADAIDEIQLETSLKAINTFGLSLDQVHLDITSFMFEGSYENPDPEFPVPKRGYNAEGDFKRRQVRTGQAVLEDGNIPIFHKTFDGNRTDSDTLMRVFDGLAFLRAHAKPKQLVHVGDSKLLSAGNMLYLLQQDVHFVAPGERGKRLAEEVLKMDPDNWIELEYASESELTKRKTAPSENWNRYWGQEFASQVVDPKTGNVFDVRRIMVRSSDEVRATRKNRERQIQKAEQELETVVNGIPRYYKTKEKVDKKVANILEARGVSLFLKVDVQPGAKFPHLTWTRDQESIERAEKISGCYPLLTNLPATRTANDVLAIQKDQYRVEHRFANWKGPLHVCPIFLHNNRRIASLLMVTAIALMIFSLIERQVRKAMGDQNGFAVGFLPERRKSRPTGTTIFYALRIVTAILVKGEPRIDRVLNIQPFVQRIHDIFGLTAENVVL
jgi:transposase